MGSFMALSGIVPEVSITMNDGSDETANTVN